MLGQLFGTQLSNVISATLNLFLSIQPVIPLLGIVPKETSKDVHGDLWFMYMNDCASIIERSENNWKWPNTQQ